MAAKAWGLQRRQVDEVFFQNDQLSLCMLINRRVRTTRVIDFRAGPSQAKRLFVLSFAQREGMEKIYTLVERDEVATWTKLGFTKEGNIPAFYKRSDAFLLGCLAAGLGQGAGRSRDPAEVPMQSETRLVAARPLTGATPMSPAQQQLERTILAAKKWLKEVPEKSMPQAKLALVGEVDARKAVGVAFRNGRALTAFEPFGRDVERRYFATTVRGGFELHASIESQACFGNAYIELLQGPRSDSEKLATTSSLSALCELLLSEGVVSCFSLAPSDDVALAAAFLQNGFRRTGHLADHLLVAGLRKDAILWSRKMANQPDD
jgi:hypothetical protein